LGQLESCWIRGQVLGCGVVARGGGEHAGGTVVSAAQLVALGCGLAGLESLDAESVQLIFADLPSGETQAAFDKRVDLPRFWAAAWGALRQGGTVLLMASSLRFAGELVASQPTEFRYDLIWEKSLAVGFLNARIRPLRAHEFILIFQRASAVFNPQFLETGVPISSIVRGTESKSENWGLGYRSQSRAGKTDRFPRSVLRFGSLPTRSKERVHPQQKPLDLLQNLVRQYSNPGDLVVDPCAGSGSMGRAALAEGRRFFGWDSDPRFGCEPDQSLAFAAMRGGMR
jgi:site-specific DNA-methyltransferase (adenine-specific)